LNPETGAQCDNAINDDPTEDPIINDGCPAVGDFSEATFNITTNPAYGCRDVNNNLFWPADFIQSASSTRKVNIEDLGSFTAPVRHYGTNPEDPEFSARWDVVPGTTLGTAWINVVDLNNVSSVMPAMQPYNGTIRAYNSPECVIQTSPP
jgi:hypothetical protein